MKKSNFGKFVLSFLTALFIASTLGAVSAYSHPSLNPYAVTACILGAQLVYGIAVHFGKIQVTVHELSGVKMNAIQQEFWVNYIIENLFKDNSFMNYCFDESDYVLEGSVVHIPQAGAKPQVVKNRATFPAIAVTRTDTDVTYTLDVFSITPTRITNAETKEVSYDKIASVYGEHVDTLEETCADAVLEKWAPNLTSNILLTTGAASAASLSPGATGTRNAFVKADLKRAQTLMNKQKIDKTDRYALIPTDMLSELMDDTDLMKRDGVNGNELDLKNGIIMRLYGFNIMERAAGVVYTNATPPVAKAYDAATATTDNQAIICWQKNAVAKAKGTVKFFENIGDAFNYGDVYSSEVKLGARKRRTNGEGVVAIVQQWVS